MPNAREITVTVVGTQTRFVLGKHGQWALAEGFGSDLTMAATSVCAYTEQVLLALIWEQKQTIADLKARLDEKWEAHRQAIIESLNPTAMRNFEARSDAEMAETLRRVMEIMPGGSQEYHEAAALRIEKLADRIIELEDTLKLRTTELETARAEMDIYRTQRDQVSAETTIDEERFQRVFWEAFREWERSVSMGFGDLTRQVLSRYLAEMTAMKPARELHEVPPVNLGGDTP